MIYEPDAAEGDRVGCSCLWWLIVVVALSVAAVALTSCVWVWDSPDARVDQRNGVGGQAPQIEIRANEVDVDPTTAPTSTPPEPPEPGVGK